KIEDGLEALLPHLPQLKLEAQMLRLASLVAAERGDRAGAISALEQIVRLSGTLTDEPLEISQLVRIGCLQTAITGMEDLLSRQRLNAAEVERLDRMLKAVNPRATLRRSL